MTDPTLTALRAVARAARVLVESYGGPVTAPVVSLVRALDRFTALGWHPDGPAPVEASAGLLGAWGWQPIDTAATDGRTLLVYAAPRDGLPGFQTTAAYHPDVGWCVDELREVTHWRDLPDDPPAGFPDAANPQPKDPQ